MPFLSNGRFSGLRLEEQGSPPANPVSGYRILYVTSAGVFVKTSAGVVKGPFTDVHNELSGLTTGDPHTQYLPLTGLRAMTGTLQLGANVILGDEISTPANPASDKRKLYAKEDGWYDLDSAGVETQLGGGGGGGPGDVTHGVLVTDTDGFILDTTYAYLPFINEEYDTDDYHDDMSNTERLTIGSGLAGLYHINAQVDLSDDFETGAVGPIQIAITLERTSVETLLASDVFWFDSNVSNVASKNLSVDWPLIVDDFVRIKVTKGFGQPAYVGAGTDMYINGWFSMRKLPPLYEAP